MKIRIEIFHSKSQKSVGAEASTKTGWAQVKKKKIKNKRSFEKPKADGVKIAYLSLNQKIEKLQYKLAM